MGFLIFLLWAGVALWIDGRLTNFHVRKALKALEPAPRCRACGEEIPGIAHELGQGGVACTMCYDEICREVGMTAWWSDNTNPLLAPEVPEQLEAEVAPPAEEDEECTWVMSGNTECVCPDCIEDTQEYWDRLMKQPGGNGGSGVVRLSENHAVVGEYRPLAENFRPTGGSKCDTCGNYHDYGTEHLLSSRYGGNGGGTHRRSVPAAELSPVVWCANCDKRVNECVC